MASRSRLGLLIRVHGWHGVREAQGVTGGGEDCAVATAVEDLSKGLPVHPRAPARVAVANEDVVNERGPPGPSETDGELHRCLLGVHAAGPAAKRILDVPHPGCRHARMEVGNSDIPGGHSPAGRHHGLAGDHSARTVVPLQPLAGFRARACTTTSPGGRAREPTGVHNGSPRGLWEREKRFSGRCAVVYDKAWNVAYRRDRDAGRRRYVDAAPVQAKLRRLVNAQVPLRTLGRVTGLSPTTVRKILDGEQVSVQRATAARVSQMRPQDVYLAQSTGHVPRIGAVRRVQALLAMGWPHHALDAAGITNSAQITGATGDLITVQRWRQVRDVYDRLSMTLGPSPETRGWAAKLGYPPPLAWDEESIDDPTATPQTSAHVAVTPAGDEVVDVVAVARAAATAGAADSLTATERHAVVRVMASRGASDAQIAEHLGVVDRTVLRWRTKLQIATGRPRGSSDTARWAAAEAREVTSRSPRPAMAGPREAPARGRAVGPGR